MKSVQQSLLISSNSYDISGSIYYNITGVNPSHTFNYESNGIQSPLMVINKTGTVFIGSSNSSNNYQSYNNERLLVEGNVFINNSNISNPSSLIIGNSNTNNCLLQTFGKIIIGTSNADVSNYSFYVNSNVKINSNLIVGSNLTLSCNLSVGSNLTLSCNLSVGGIISGNGCNLNTIKISSLVLDGIYNSNKLNANYVRINSNTGINVSNNDLILNYDNTKFLIDSSNRLSLSNSAVPSFWLSAQINETDPKNVSNIYFNNGISYVGILNDAPKSYLYIGRKGTLLRLATENVADSHFSQIGTNDLLDNSNHTKIKLVKSVQQSLLISSNSYDISGSIYYNITGFNPSHTFNYENNGIQTPLMIINNTGSVIIGPSNVDASLYSLYVNSNVKINSNITINGNITGSNNATFINTVTIGQSATPALNLSGYQLNVNGNMGLTGNIFTISDETVKMNVKTYDNALNRIINCRGVTFNYINNFNKDKLNIGVIAQEIEKVIPEVVETNIDGIKNVNYLALIGVLIEAIKELNKKIDIKI